MAKRLSRGAELSVPRFPTLATFDHVSVRSPIYLFQLVICFVQTKLLYIHVEGPSGSSSLSCNSRILTWNIIRALNRVRRVPFCCVRQPQDYRPLTPISRISKLSSSMRDQQTARVSLFTVLRDDGNVV